MERMNDEWKVYHYFASTPDVRQEIVDIVSELAKTLKNNSELADFYYNIYYLPTAVPPVSPYVRFGFYKLKNEKAIKTKIEKLEKQGKITKVEQKEPDLKDVDGIVVDKIKLTARKITELVKKDFEKSITPKQAFYLIHLSMNPLFGYVDERNIYLELTRSMEKTIRDNNILPKEQWLSLFLVTDFVQQ